MVKYLVWTKKKTSFKCEELPSDGNGMPSRDIHSKHVLLKDEETLSLSVLERLHPYQE